MRFIFRAGRVPLARVFGGGTSGLALFAKTMKARLDRDPRAELSRQERAFVETALKNAWIDARKRWGDDASRWHTLALSEVQRQTLGYLAGLDEHAMD